MTYNVFLIVLLLCQGWYVDSVGPLDSAVLQKLKSIQQYLDSMSDVTVFDYIFRVNRGVGLNLFQGDIKGYNPMQSMHRTAITNRQQLWNTRVVPYVIDSSFDSIARKDIMAAIDEYHAKTCIRFVPRTSESDYVHFKQISGCYSNIGRVGGEQEISLMGACLKKGTAIHEMMHAIGFWHEQSRPDRDSWVQVITGNIQSGKEYNFDKLSSSEADTLGVQYDYGSVMHYSRYAFSKNGNPTILPTRQTDAELGQREGLSDLDVFRIRKLYGCDIDAPKTTAKVEKPTSPKPPPTFPPTTLPPTTMPPKTTPKKDTPAPTTKPAPKTTKPQVKITNPPQTMAKQTSTVATVKTEKPTTKPVVVTEIKTATPTNVKTTAITNPAPTIKSTVIQTKPAPSTIQTVIQTNIPQTAIQTAAQTNPLPTAQPVNQAGWTAWSSWSPCDMECKHSRYRFCLNYDASYCPGDNSQISTCGAPCKPTVSLGCWKVDKTNLSIPSVEGMDPNLTGDYKGRYNAVEKCRNYAASHGLTTFALYDRGMCLTGPGAESQYRTGGISNGCSNRQTGGIESINVYSFDKDVDGQWSLWTGWGPCTKSCGSGRQHRYRRCDNPPPRGNGADCGGNSEEIAVCFRQPCIVPTKCGTKFHAGAPGSSGLIWVRDYENFMECDYQIATGDPMASISIYIQELDVEYSRGCIYDRIELYDGRSSNSPLVGTFCGKTTPGSFESSSRFVYLKFTSDETNTGRGYTIFYNINSRSRKACVKPPPEAHASISTEGNMVGNRAWYSCQPGYKLVGHSPITCLNEPGFALWNDHFPRCVHMRKRSVVQKTSDVCTFDQSLCGLQKDSRSDFNWVVKRPELHTNDSEDLEGKGNYLHAESTPIQAPGDLARIQLFSQNKEYSMTHCLYYSYKIDGAAFAMLRVYVSHDSPNTNGAVVQNATMTNGEPSESLLSTVTGQNENIWVPAQLQINLSSPFAVTFEAVIGEETGSSVSLDDILLTSGTCREQ